MNEIKRCSACNTDKKHSEFYKDKSKKDELCCICKECKNFRHRAVWSKHYIKNKTKILDRNKKWREANKEKSNASKREYYKKNKKQALANADKLRNKKLDWFWSQVDPYCRHCFYDKSTAALQIHHIDPSQKENGKDNFSTWVRKLSFENFKEKALTHKYIILCANCHAELHSGLWSVGNDPYNDSVIFQGVKA